MRSVQTSTTAVKSVSQQPLVSPVTKDGATVIVRSSSRAVETTEVDLIGRVVKTSLVDSSTEASCIPKSNGKTMFSQHGTVILHSPMFNSKAASPVVAHKSSPVESWLKSTDRSSSPEIVPVSTVDLRKKKRATRKTTRKDALLKKRTKSPMSADQVLLAAVQEAGIGDDDLYLDSLDEPFETGFDSSENAEMGVEASVQTSFFDVRVTRKTNLSVRLLHVRFALSSMFIQLRR
jgi:hypothetical protein